MKKIFTILAFLASFAFSQSAEVGVPNTGTFSTCNLSGTTFSCGVTGQVNRIYLKLTPQSQGQAVSGGFDDAYLPIGVSAFPVTINGIDYTVNVTRPGSNPDTDNTLSGLQVIGGAQTFVLNPGFAAATTVYNVAIPYATSSVTVNATPRYQEAGLEYLDGPTGNTRISNANIALEDGTPRIVRVRVIAEDATVANNFYTVTLNRAEGNTNNDLASLDVCLNGDCLFNNIMDDFDSRELEYDLEVPHSVSTVTIRGARVSQHVGDCTGCNQQNRPLAVGQNVFTITVIPEKGASKTYTVTITRDAAPNSSSSNGGESSSSNGGGESSSSNGGGESSSSNGGGESSSSNGGGESSSSNGGGESSSSNGGGTSSSSNGGGESSSSNGGGESSSSNGGGTPSSSSAGDTSIFANRENPKIGAIGVQTYYNLKGTPVGTIKPTIPGVYIEKHGEQMRKIVVH
ncbi:MAG: cadherin-like beta sandwich domain-containing protein [Fibromonadaceae bacterium]|jgi:hypothetical protein|nr:cadherin-like beta sandwich domain-containing protein [Fibromonadaceae bacterium]